MTKRIIYVEPGDTLELRVCTGDEGASYGAWDMQTHQSKIILGIESTDRIVVPDVGLDIIAGLGRQQFLRQPTPSPTHTNHEG